MVEHGLRKVRSSSALSAKAGSLYGCSSGAASPTASTASSSFLSRPTTQISDSTALTEYSQSSQTAQSKDQSAWKTALGEAQYFAGGLITRSFESTRHYSIIRHSHALVWYRGPSTSVAITILSDQPLPQDRSVWLQQKGYSGNMGMSLKALVGTNGDWLDVTPAARVEAHQLADSDERGWQRDLNRFCKKASGRMKKHSPRETMVIRVPATAADGYFRLILCSGPKGKKILCGSPVIRIASTSANVAVVKGASLKTMPLEMGVKVGSFVAQQAAKKYVGVVGAVVQSRAKKVMDGVAATKVARENVDKARKAREMIGKGYEMSGMGEVVDDSWRRGKEAERSFEPTMGAEEVEKFVGGEMRVVGAEDGPMEPFPIKFGGKNVVQESERLSAELGIPTLRLGEVSEDVKLRMKGVYAAWVKITTKGNEDSGEADWQEAIVSIAPLGGGFADVVRKNRVIVQVIQDGEDFVGLGSRVRVLLMGYIRSPTTTSISLSQSAAINPNITTPGPAQPPTTQALIKRQPCEATAIEEEQRYMTFTQDAMMTLASLDRDNWSPEEALVRVKDAKERLNGDKTLITRGVDEVTMRVQRKMDAMPLHWAGVRSESGKLRDGALGAGGYWVAR